MVFFVVDFVFWKDSFAIRRKEEIIQGRKRIHFVKKTPITTNNTVSLYNSNIMMIDKDSFVVAIGNSPIQNFLDEEVIRNEHEDLGLDYLNLIKAWLSTSCLLWDQTIYVPLINGESLFDCVEKIGEDE